MFGNQLGNAIGFLIPPALVTSSADENGLRLMFYSMAAICTILFITIVLIFKEKPKTIKSLFVACIGQHKMDKNVDANKSRLSTLSYEKHNVDVS